MFREAESQVPLLFVRRIPRERHCALFYENVRYARNIEFSFLEEGLTGGDRCIYLIHSDTEASAMREKMRTRPKLVEAISSGKLSFYRDPYVPNSPSDIADLIAARRSAWRQGPSEFLRLVGATLPEITNPTQVSTQSEVDAQLQISVKDSKTTILCSYPVEKVETELRDQWFMQMIAQHHSAIFAPEASEGIAFDMR